MSRGAPPVLKWMRSKSILVVDDYEAVPKMVKQKLTEGGFLEVKTATDLDSAWQIVSNEAPDVLLMDIHFQREDDLDGLVFIRRAIDAGYRGRAVALSSDISLSAFYAALAAGAQDYWCKLGVSNHTGEVVNLLQRSPTDPLAPWNPENIGRLGYFRTRGLPEPSQKALLEYARDFSRYREVATRLKRSPKQFKKTMAEAEHLLRVKSQGELAKLLTACELMGRRPYFDE